MEATHGLSLVRVGVEDHPGPSAWERGVLGEGNVPGIWNVGPAGVHFAPRAEVLHESPPLAHAAGASMPVTDRELARLATEVSPHAMLAAAGSVGNDGFDNEILVPPPGRALDPDLARAVEIQQHGAAMLDEEARAGRGRR